MKLAMAYSTQVFQQEDEMAWIVKKMLPSKTEQIERNELRAQLKGLCEEEKRLERALSILTMRDGKKKDEVQPEVELRIADGHGSGIIDGLLDGSTLGHGIGLVIRTFRKITNLGPVTVSVNTDTLGIKERTKRRLAEIVSEKKLLEARILALEIRLGVVQKDSRRAVALAPDTPKIPHR